MGFDVAPGSADLRRPVLDQILKLPKTISSREEDKIEDESCSVVKPNNLIFSLSSLGRKETIVKVWLRFLRLYTFQRHVSATCFGETSLHDHTARPPGRERKKHRCWGQPRRVGSRSSEATV